MDTVTVGLNIAISAANLMGFGALIFKIGRFTGKYEEEMANFRKERSDFAVQIEKLERGIQTFQEQQFAAVKTAVRLDDLMEQMKLVRARTHDQSQQLTVLMAMPERLDHLQTVVDRIEQQRDR